jgi:hypothetical protein
VHTLEDNSGLVHTLWWLLTGAAAAAGAAAGAGGLQGPPLIVPRVIFELSPQDLVKALQNQQAVIAMIVEELQKQGLDGLVSSTSNKSTSSIMVCAARGLRLSTPIPQHHELCTLGTLCMIMLHRNKAPGKLVLGLKLKLAVAQLRLPHCRRQAQPRQPQQVCTCFVAGA